MRTPAGCSRLPCLVPGTRRHQPDRAEENTESELDRGPVGLGLPVEVQPAPISRHYQQRNVPLFTTVGVLVGSGRQREGVQQT
ncbi:protein of unknown function [Bradyrhizobium vignae]|uniref:Uncharacterized protein n=1 Tax=Bradyrhizobium vignae TaxID=1549949 RepID=A0A2U3Q961_9BRAD|nr:protein of unknown function [Bradyrhizobium vignae]